MSGTGQSGLCVKTGIKKRNKFLNLIVYLTGIRDILSQRLQMITFTQDIISRQTRVVKLFTGKTNSCQSSGRKNSTSEFSMRIKV